MRHCFGVLAAALVVSSAACASSSSTAPPAATTAIVAVVPAGGATGVDPAAPVVIAFSHAMPASTQMLVSLHEGSIGGPLVAGTTAWSASRDTLTFAPAAPLAPHTTYVLHVGGGMTDAAGEPVDYGRCDELGGERATRQMMQGGMMGTDGGEMGPGWQGRDGSYGMLFTFTTA